MSNPVTESRGGSRRWAAHPLQAWSVRGFVVLAPLAGSFIFVRVASTQLRPPTSSLWLFLVWWFGLSAAATLVLLGVDRLARRLLPLAALLKLSLVFPDETPSRLKTALRSGSVDTLEKRLELVRAAKAASTPREAAARLLELVAALNAHDQLTRGHSERVRAYSVLIGTELGLKKEELDLLNWAALLHDIGKLEVRQGILTKPGKPSEQEWQELRQHPLLGEELTAPLSVWLDRWQAAVGYHHERWDGKGYPRGLAGEEIPLAGRIVAVADVFDVMTSARSYKHAGTSVEAREEIAHCAGEQFDPRVVRAFLNVSLGRMRIIMGPLSWLSHAPLLGRLPLTPAFAAIASTLSVVAAAAVSGGIAHPLDTPVATTTMTQAVAAVPARTVSVSSHVVGYVTVPPRLAAPTVARPATDRAPAHNPPKVPAATSVPPAKGTPPPATPPATPPTTATPPRAPDPLPANTVLSATQLAFTTQPPAESALGAPITVQVSVEDIDDDVVTADNSTTVTLALAGNPGGATLACANPGGSGPVTVVSGVATFTCSLNAPGGGYTLRASDTTAGGGLPYTAATSSAFNITAGAPAQLAFTAQPTSTAAGAALSPAVRVAVEDGLGNIITSDNTTTVTVALGSNPGSGTLAGTTTQTVSGGIATFNNLSLNAAANGYTLTAASAPTHRAATSSAFNITAGTPAQLAFTAQPTSSTAGAVLPPAVRVAVEDSLGNIVTSDNTTTVTVALGSNPGSGTLAGTTTQTVSGGIATFSNLSLSAAAAGYTLTATSSPTHGTATSSAFNITAGAPAQLAFTAQPTTTAAGAALSPAVRVAVEDSLGNIVTSDNATTVTVALGANPGAATLAGTTTQTVSAGIATFNNLSLNSAANGYTLTATSSPTHGTATSSAFNITAGTPAQLAFTAQPTTAAAGAALSPAVRVAVEDSLGNIVTSDNTTTVTVALGTNPGAATLSGTTTQTVSAGIATFSNLSLNAAAAGYTLTATSSPTDGAATSSAFNITAGAAAQLAFTAQPTTAAAGAALSPAVRVAVEDSLGNIVTSDNATTVTVALGANPGAATLAGTTTQTVSAGIATFNNLSLNAAANGYTLTAASAPTHGAATSSAFNITAGAPAQLAFTAQPTSSTAGAVLSPAVRVAVEDSLGNIVTSDSTTTVTVALGANPGAATLSGTTTQTVSGGIATFNNLSLNAAANGYTLTATSSPAHGAATSSSFNITPNVVAATLLTTNSTTPCTSGASCTTASFSATPGATLLIVAVRGGSTTTSDNVTSVTGPLSGAVAVTGIEYPTSISSNYLFVVKATATGATGAVTVNFTGGSNANPTVIDVIQLSGNDTATPVAQAPANNGTSLILGGASADLTSPNASNGEIVVASFLAGGAQTTPSGFTALDAFALGGAVTMDYGLYFNASAQASTSISAPGLGFLTGWGTLALELNHA